MPGTMHGTSTGARLVPVEHAYCLSETHAGLQYMHASHAPYDQYHYCPLAGK